MKNGYQREWRLSQKRCEWHEWTANQRIAPIRTDNPQPMLMVERQMRADCRFFRTRAANVCMAIAMVKKPPEKVPMAMKNAKKSCQIVETGIAKQMVAYPGHDRGDLIWGLSTNYDSQSKAF